MSEKSAWRWPDKHEKRKEQSPTRPEKKKKDISDVLFLGGNVTISKRGSKQPEEKRGGGEKERGKKLSTRNIPQPEEKRKKKKEGEAELVRQVKTKDQGGPTAPVKPGGGTKKGMKKKKRPDKKSKKEGGLDHDTRKRHFTAHVSQDD